MSIRVSIDVRPTYVTSATISTRSPTYTGPRNIMESIAAVVICPLPACRNALTAPHSSASRKRTPPWMVPNALAWPGSVMIARLIRDADAGFASVVSFSIRALLPGIQLIAASRNYYREGRPEGLRIERGQFRSPGTG